MAISLIRISDIAIYRYTINDVAEERVQHVCIRYEDMKFRHHQSQEAATARMSSILHIQKHAH